MPCGSVFAPIHEDAAPIASRKGKLYDTDPHIARCKTKNDSCQAKACKNKKKKDRNTVLQILHKSCTRTHPPSSHPPGPFCTKLPTTVVLGIRHALSGRRFKPSMFWDGCWATPMPKPPTQPGTISSTRISK